MINTLLSCLLAAAPAPAAPTDLFPVQEVPQVKPQAYADETGLPSGLKWESGPQQLQPWGSTEAKKGGKLVSFLPTYPKSFRHFGPASNDSFRSYLDNLNLAQLSSDPNHPEITLPSLCQQWAIGPDRKTVYYRIDPEARWSDGNPVLASDFTYAQELVHDPDLEHPDLLAGWDSNISDIKSHGRLSFSVTLSSEKPADELLYYSGTWPVDREFWMKFQREALKKDGKNPDENFGALIKDWHKYFDDAGIAEPVTGPYMIDSAKCEKMRKVVFTKTPNWWAEKKPWNLGRYNVETIEYKVIEDLEVAFRFFQGTELDCCYLTMPEIWREKAGESEGFLNGWFYRVMAFNDVQQPMIGMYLNTRSAPLDDLQVRRALWHATDVEGMCKTVLRGEYARMPHILMGYRQYDNKELKGLPFNIDSAVALLEEAGWNQMDIHGVRMKNGKRLSIEINYSQKTHVPRILYIRQQALKAGIELVLKKYEATTSFNKTRRRQGQIFWIGWQGNYFPDFRDGYHSDGAYQYESNNTSNYEDPRIDKLIEAMDLEKDSAAKTRQCHEIQKIIQDQALVIPLYYVPYIRSGAWNWVKLPQVVSTKTNGDEIFEAFGISGGLFWIDEEEKKKTLSAREAKQKLGEPKTIIDPTWKMAE